MEGITLILSLLIFAGLFWLHRRLVESAYAAGWAAALKEQGRLERNGLAELPEDAPTT